MNMAWILWEFVKSDQGEDSPQIVGVFASKESVISAMRPNEVAVPFEIDKRLPCGTQRFIPGEIQTSPDGVVFDRSPQE